jgi:hypothetical protein
MPSTSRSRVWKTGREADMGSPPIPMMGCGEAVGVGRGPPHERPDGTISPTAGVNATEAWRPEKKPG